jgi:hypothetical protein
MGSGAVARCHSFGLLGGVNGDKVFMENLTLEAIEDMRPRQETITLCQNLKESLQRGILERMRFNNQY